MNRSGIFIGGLVAGLLIVLGESALWSLVVEPALDAGRIVRVGVPPAVFLLRSALLGIACVYLYAAIRPRFGAGPKTAARAGLLGFLLSLVYPPFGLAMSTFPGPVLLGAMAWSAVEMPLAAMAGARFYHESALSSEPDAPSGATEDDA